MRIRIDHVFITTFVVLLNLFTPNAFSDVSVEKNTETEPFTFSVDSPYDFDETIKRVQEAVLSNDFRVFPDRYLEQGLTEDFSVNERQLVIRFCHFGTLYKVLKIEPRLGVVLPCKITVLEKADGQVQMIYINAEALANVFDNKQLTVEAQGIAENYSDILDEVLL